MPDWKHLRRSPLLPLAALLGTALAAPVLPGSNVAESALNSALTLQPTASAPAREAAPVVAAPAKAAAPSPVKVAPAKVIAKAPEPKPAPKKAVVKPAPKPAAKPAKPKADSAAELRQKAIQQAQRAAAARGARSAIVRATAYNSLGAQTDSSPTITATGTRVRFGVIALSRDLLRRFPYGTKVMLQDMSGRYNTMLDGKVFVVEDTMHPRMSNTIDVWMPSRGQAMQWGARNVRITAVR